MSYLHEAFGFPYSKYLKICRLCRLGKAGRKEKRGRKKERKAAKKEKRKEDLIPGFPSEVDFGVGTHKHLNIFGIFKNQTVILAKLTETAKNKIKSLLSLSANSVADNCGGASIALSGLMSTQINKKKGSMFRLINSPKAAGPDSESSPSHFRAQALDRLSPPLICSAASLLQSKTHLLVLTSHYQLGNCYLNQLLRSAMCPS